MTPETLVYSSIHSIKCLSLLRLSISYARLAAARAAQGSLFASGTIVSASKTCFSKSLRPYDCAFISFINAGLLGTVNGCRLPCPGDRRGDLLDRTRVAVGIMRKARAARRDIGICSCSRSRNKACLASSAYLFGLRRFVKRLYAPSTFTIPRSISGARAFSFSVRGLPTAPSSSFSARDLRTSSGA